MKNLLTILLLVLSVSCSKSSVSAQKTYKIGVDPSFFPTEIGQQKSNVYAFTRDIFAKISEDYDCLIVIVPLGWDDLIYEMALGRVDAVISAASPNLINTDKFCFSDPLLRTGPVLVVPIASKAHNLSELAGKVVAISRGNNEFEIIADNPKTEFMFYDRYTSALELTTLGNIQGTLIPILPAARYVTDLFHESLKIVTVPLTNEALRLLTPLNSKDMAIKDRGAFPDSRIEARRAEILPLFNSAITKFLDNGEYNKLLHKWTLSQ